MSDSSPTSPASRPPQRKPLWRRPLALSVWLSDRLSFSRKYLLIGVIMLLAMTSLSVPLWQKVHQDLQAAELERAGLRQFLSMARLLSAVVNLRDQAVDTSATPDWHALDDRLAAVVADAGSNPLAPPLAARWQLLQSLETHASPSLRFAALNGVINSLLALMQSSSQSYRLNVDHEMDATFAMLTVRLPQLLDTLGKQQAAVKLDSGEFAPYALGAQVFLTESRQSLREGTLQLSALHPESALRLNRSMSQLLEGMDRQQDAADKTLDSPQAWDELKAVAISNEARARSFLETVAAVADDYLLIRIHSLNQTQWIIGGLLIGAIAAVFFLFAGIYLSTMRSLRRLAKGTADFCAGRLDTRISLAARDELVSVASNFNTVAAEFGRLLDVIREQNESREKELATQVAARTAELAEKNEQLQLAGQRVQSELALARDMQLAILPQEFPDEKSWGVHACMFPARELGGDFYDVFMLPDGRCGVLVADVSGKGVAAAFFMAVSRTVLLDLATSGLPPAQVLEQANELLCQRNPMEMFVTVCYGVFDPHNGRLTYASGGHPAPLLRKLDGQVDLLPCANDLALAVMPGMSYIEKSTRLEAGDTLLLFTDGVTEAFDSAGEAYGDDRLRRWLKHSEPSDGAAELVQKLVLNVEEFVSGAEASDDLTCLILCRKQGAVRMPSPMPHLPVELTNKVLLLEHRLPSRLQEIEALADAVNAALPDRSDLAFSANLCLEELITNIIRHGLKGESDRQIHVRMSISDEWLEIILKDDAPQFDPFVEAPEPDLDMELDDRPIGGLGVHLVKTLMDDARAYYDGSGNLIVLLKTLRKPEN